jgi:hypothetical protein
MANLWDFLTTTWPGQLILALLLWPMAIHDYWHGITYWSGNPVSLVHRLICSNFGKWGCFSFWGLPAAVFTFVGIWNLAVRIVYGKSDDE